MPAWLQDSIAARMMYQYEEIEKHDRYAKNAITFASQVRSCFTEDDYREFIGKTENFALYYFTKYLEDFCKRHGITAYTDTAVSRYEKCFMEDAAFSTVLQLSERTLIKNARSFWKRLIAEELYNENI